MGIGLKLLMLSCFPNRREPLPVSAEREPSGPPPQSPDPVASIKKKLMATGVFDEQSVTLEDWQKDELREFWETVEIMASSRARQPDAAQNMFATIGELERLMRKLHQKGKLSDELAGMFHWEKLNAWHQKHPLQAAGPSHVKTLHRVDEKINMRNFH